MLRDQKQQRDQDHCHQAKDDHCVYNDLLLLTLRLSDGADRGRPYAEPTDHFQEPGDKLDQDRDAQIVTR
jgi:hypothetical protein